MTPLQTFLQTLPFGFMTTAQVEALITLDRFHPVLIRCGACRVTCAAQYVLHVIHCIDAGGDYVRDVSVPAGSLERAASLAPKPKPYVNAWTREAKAAPNTWSHHIGNYGEDEWRGDNDGL